MTTKNTNRVHASQWDKWEDDQQRLFNSVCANVKRLGNLMLHPKTGALSRAELNTIAWNAAWVAAEQLRGDAVEVAA